ERIRHPGRGSDYRGCRGGSSDRVLVCSATMPTRRALPSPPGGAAGRNGGAAAEGRRQLQFIAPSGERPTFYTNNTQVRLSLVDAVFDLGVVESADANKVVVKQTARVIMAIPHVKRLAAALNRQIEDYEQQH